MTRAASYYSHLLIFVLWDDGKFIESNFYWKQEALHPSTTTQALAFIILNCSLIQFERCRTIWTPHVEGKASQKALTLYLHYESSCFLLRFEKSTHSEKWNKFSPIDCHPIRNGNATGWKCFIKTIRCTYFASLETLSFDECHVPVSPCVIILL